MNVLIREIYVLITVATLLVGKTRNNSTKTVFIFILGESLLIIQVQYLKGILQDVFTSLRPPRLTTKQQFCPAGLQVNARTDYPQVLDKSEPFHLRRWVTPQSLVTGLALAN